MLPLLSSIWEGGGGIQKPKLLKDSHQKLFSLVLIVVWQSTLVFLLCAMNSLVIFQCGKSIEKLKNRWLTSVYVHDVVFFN